MLFECFICISNVIITTLWVGIVTLPPFYTWVGVKVRIWTLTIWFWEHAFKRHTSLISTAANLFTIKADSKLSLHKRKLLHGLENSLQEEGPRKKHWKKVWSESNDLSLSASADLFLIALFYVSVLPLALWGPNHYFTHLIEVCKVL